MVVQSLQLFSIFDSTITRGSAKLLEELLFAQARTRNVPGVTKVYDFLIVLVAPTASFVIELGLKSTTEPAVMFLSVSATWKKLLKRDTVAPSPWFFIIEEKLTLAPAFTFILFVVLGTVVLVVKVGANAIRSGANILTVVQGLQLFPSSDSVMTPVLFVEEVWSAQARIYFVPKEVKI